jgi:tetratricopeptide (TPR) repeat protein
MPQGNKGAGVVEEALKDGQEAVVVVGQREALGLAVRERQVSSARPGNSFKPKEHFDRVWDSMRIYFVLRFYFSAIMAAGIDLAGFSIAFAVTGNVPASILFGRLSSLLNFALNKRFVFHNRAPVSGVLWRYYALVAADGRTELSADLDPEPVRSLECLHPPVQDAAFWINLSLDQYKQAQYPQSIESARRALRLDPNSAEAYTNIGADYGAMRQWDEAIQNEREALRPRPDLQLARNNLNWYLQQSAAVRARSSADAAIGAKPTAEDFINESLDLNQAGRYAESIAAARKALQLSPDSGEAWNNIAADNEALHRWDDAIVAAQRAISLKLATSSQRTIWPGRSRRRPQEIN